MAHEKNKPVNEYAALRDMQAAADAKFQAANEARAAAAAAEESKQVKED